ncbi:MAG TPA: hypothetical protein VFG10_03860 [Saprospiraceae bacterium]|nr:hypothetical protein [Saprospiraceae bacterium]
MNRHKYIVPILIWTVFLSLTSCSNHTSNKSLTDKIVGDNSSIAIQKTNTATTDSLTIQNDGLTKIYTQAIAEFIKAAYQKDKTTFDTLYFGKHIYGQPDDFPDIELPETIENTQIRLVSPEVGQKKQAERKSLVYVNMIGWVEKEKAEFVLLVFTKGGEHQYDYFINFNYSSSSDKFELDKIEFENYLHSNGQNPKRITIYKDGQYVGDK